MCEDVRGHCARSLYPGEMPPPNASCPMGGVCRAQEVVPSHGVGGVTDTTVTPGWPGRQWRILTTPRPCRLPSPFHRPASRQRRRNGVGFAWSKPVDTNATRKHTAEWRKPDRARSELVGSRGVHCSPALLQEKPQCCRRCSRNKGQSDPPAPIADKRRAPITTHPCTCHHPRTSPHGSLPSWLREGVCVCPCSPAKGN